MGQWNGRNGVLEYIRNGVVEDKKGGIVVPVESITKINQRNIPTGWPETSGSGVDVEPILRLVGATPDLCLPSKALSPLEGDPTEMGGTPKDLVELL